MRVITVFNQKGGVGKTSTAANLGRAMALRGRAVMLLDTDVQAHLSLSVLGSATFPGFFDVLAGNRQLQAVIRCEQGMRVVPAGALGEPGSQALRDHLSSLVAFAREEDLTVIVDCPPAINDVTREILMVSTTVLVPVASDFLAMQGLSDILQTLEQVESGLNRKLDLRVVLTRYDGRRRLSQEVRERLEAYFPGRVAPCPVRECVAIAEAPGFCQSVIDYRPDSNGARDYLALADFIDNLHLNQGGEK